MIGKLFNIFLKDDAPPSQAISYTVEAFDK